MNAPDTPQTYQSVLLFGGPGVGKGTQGALLGAIAGFHHCASGDLFRSVDSDTELGRIFNEYSSRGELVPDDVTIQMWADAMTKRIDAGQYNPRYDLLILDGIPRTAEQASFLDRHLDVLKLIYLTCGDEQVMTERLRRRAVKQNRKDDADENVIRRRWRVYEEESTPVLKHYSGELIIRVEAIGSPAMVLCNILNVLAPLQDQHFARFEG